MVSEEFSENFERLPIGKPNQRNHLLWVMNVAWVGGTGLWVLENIRAMSLWYHTVVFLNGEPVFQIIEDFVEAGADISKATAITKEMVAAIDPIAIILSNTDPHKIEGGHPWSWIPDHLYTIYVHHSAITPWMPGANMDVFVSEHLKSQYRNLLEWMRSVKVCPPLGELSEYLSIPRIQHDRCVIGRVSSDERKKFPGQLLGILKASNQKCILVGGSKYFGKAPAGWRYPDFGSEPVRDLLTEMDIFVYRTDLTETWCRCVTEAMASGIPVVVEKRGGPAEQVRDGIDGFVCETDAEFIEKLKKLAADPSLRFRMGKHARERAKQLAKQNFKNQIEPLLIKHALGGC